MGQIWPDDSGSNEPTPFRTVAAAFLIAVALVAVIFLCSAVTL